MDDADARDPSAVAEALRKAPADFQAQEDRGRRVARLAGVDRAIRRARACWEHGHFPSSAHRAELLQALWRAENARSEHLGLPPRHPVEPGAARIRACLLTSAWPASPVR